MTEKDTLAILDHPFINNVDKTAIALMTAPVPCIPEGRVLAPYSTMPASHAFTGNNSLFAGFGNATTNFLSQNYS